MQRVTITSMWHHTSYQIFSFSLAWFGAICNGLPRVTVILIIYIYFLKKKKRNESSAWKRVANSQKPGKSQRKYTVTLVATRVVTHSSYGNALHYGLSMFAEFRKLPYPSVTSVSARFHKSSYLLLCNLLNI